MYRLKRYHVAKVGDKTETIGFSGLSCAGCDSETKKVRGCHLPGFSYRSQYTWRIDYHEPLGDRDRALFCPASLLALYPEVAEIIDEALEMKEEGLAAYAGEAPANLDAWYNGAYRLVMGVSARAVQETEAAASNLSVQKRREQEARTAASWASGRG